MDSSYDPILVMFQSIKDDYSALSNKVDDINKRLVGWEQCGSMRETCQQDNETKFSDLFDRMNNTEKTCNQLETTSHSMVTKENLAKTEGNVMKVAQSKDDEILLEIQKINDKLAILDFSWKTIKRCLIENKIISAIILTITGSIFLTLIEVTIGRLHDFGIIP